MSTQTSASRKTHPALLRHGEERARTFSNRLADTITRHAGSMGFVYAHVLAFVAWMIWLEESPWPTLTLIVSLEAIFLALFVLASQNRLAHQSDKRAHLDLQIDLLAEREMTAVLQLLQDIARKIGVEGTVTAEQISDLVKKTDIHKLTDELEEMPEPGLEPKAD